MENVLQVGIISSTHGVRGEVKVFPTTDDVKRFGKLKEVLIETEIGRVPFKIESVKFFKQFAILKFEGYDNINDIEKYKGKSLFVTRENAVKLEKDEYFIADLIGMEVVSDDGCLTGRIRDVLQTGANDVYIIDLTDGRELLLPAIKECVLEISFHENILSEDTLSGETLSKDSSPEKNSSNGRMTIHVLDGLLDDGAGNGKRS